MAMIRLSKPSLQKGADIVDDLFQVTDSDRRLVRAVQQSRFPYGLPSLGTVAGPGRIAIQDILQVSWRGDLGQMRAFWDATRSMSPPERWLYVLQDESAGGRAWVESAEKLTSVASNRGRIPKEATMRGEVLRGTWGHEINTLMDRRVLHLLEQARRSQSHDEFLVTEAAELAVYRAKWGSHEVVNLMKTVFEEGMRVSKTRRRPYGGLGTQIVRTIDWRLRLGDSTALNDFRMMLTHANWIESSNLYTPLWRHRQRSEVRKLAADLFLSAESPSNVVNGYAADTGFAMRNVLDSPLWLLESFRTAVVRGLRDKSFIASLVRRGNQIESSKRSYMADMDDPLLPREGESVPLRLCDLVMSDLHFRDRPKFKSYWPNSEKDRVIAEVVSLIEREGEAFAERFHFIDVDPWIR